MLPSHQWNSLFLHRPPNISDKHLTDENYFLCQTWAVSDWLKAKTEATSPQPMLPRMTQTNTDPNLVILSFPLTGCLSPIYTHTIFLSISPTHFYNAHIYKYSITHMHNFSPFSPGSGDAVMTIGSRHRSALFI